MSKVIETIDRYARGDALHGYDKTCHSGPDYQRRVLDPFIERVKKLTQNPLVLDLASGKGESSRYLEGNSCRCIQLELSLIALEAASGHRVRGLMDELPFPENCFDAIHCKDALIHQWSIVKLLLEAQRVLRPGGRLLIVTQPVQHGYVGFVRNTDRKVTGLPILDLGTYIEMVNLLERLVTEDNQPLYSCIGPPYFEVSIEKIISLAKLLKFKVKRLKNWKPPVDQPDWHDEPNKRFVVELTKTT